MLPRDGKEEQPDDTVEISGLSQLEAVLRKEPFSPVVFTIRRHSLSFEIALSWNPEQIRAKK